MPNYDYICDKCDYTAEIFQSMKDAPIVICPKCHEPAFRRLIGTGAGIIFKGSGFYQTDYKNSKSSAVSESTTSSAKATPCGGGCACHPPKKTGQSASNVQAAS